MVGLPDDPLIAAKLMQADEVRRKLQLDEVRGKLSPGDSEEKKLKDACEGFESIFLNKLWQQMRKTVNKSEYLHSKEEDAYLGMFDQEMSIKLARSGGMGLGKQLFEQLQERLTAAGSITHSIARQTPPDQLRQPHRETDAMPLRRDPASLRQPGRPVGGQRDQAAALAVELAQRIVAEHLAGEDDAQALDGPGDVASGFDDSGGSGSGGSGFGDAGFGDAE